MRVAVGMAAIFSDRYQDTLLPHCNPALQTWVSFRIHGFVFDGLSVGSGTTKWVFYQHEVNLAPALHPHMR